MVVVALSRPSPAEVREWVRRSTQSQGLDEQVTDPKVASDVATLLTAGREPVPDPAVPPRGLAVAPTATSPDRGKGGGSVEEKGAGVTRAD